LSRLERQLAAAAAPSAAHATEADADETVAVMAQLHSIVRGESGERWASLGSAHERSAQVVARAFLTICAHGPQIKRMRANQTHARKSNACAQIKRTHARTHACTHARTHARAHARTQIKRMHANQTHAFIHACTHVTCRTVGLRFGSVDLFTAHLARRRFRRWSAQQPSAPLERRLPCS
jgi:hypothetical protein